MDIKWKNKISLIALLLLFAYGISGILAAFFTDKDYFHASYFKTSQFEEEVENFTQYINEFQITYESKEKLKSNIEISKEEIEIKREEFGDLTQQISMIDEEYQSRIEEAKANNNQKAADIYIKERDKKIEEISNKFNSDEQVKKQILSEKEEKIDKYYDELEEYRDEYNDYQKAFLYYLKNTRTGEVYTNLPTSNDSLIENHINKENTYYIENYPNKKGDYLEIKEGPLVYGYEDIPQLPREGSRDLYEGTIAVSKNASYTNSMMMAFKSYDYQRLFFWVHTITTIIALLAGILMEKKYRLIHCIAPRKWQSNYNKIPLDITFLLLGVFFIIFLALSQDILNILFNYDVDGYTTNILALTIFYSLLLNQGIFLYRRLIAIRSEEDIWRKTVIGRILVAIATAWRRLVNTGRKLFLNRRVLTQVILILTIVFLFGVGTSLIFIEEDFLVLYVPALLLVGIPLFILIINRTAYFNQILFTSHALANGEFEPDLKIIGRSVFARLAKDINSMKMGVKKSITDQAKSERLKTELITNVSHDLRTPLTSIITYSELLKNNEISEDERHSYIEIIDRKSKRLKVLIDDLFEVSKMSSGTMQLSKERVDIVQLLQQSLAEYNVQLEDSLIQFRISSPESPVYVYVDGQKLWRVFENLIGNIIKYSLEQTRAYISIKESVNEVVITFKNVSKYELSEDADELYERFKRGDQSRHTEGSGLGLAIAKSIIDLHEGSLDIDVDGDLFKVTVKLNK